MKSKWILAPVLGVTLCALGLAAQALVPLHPSAPAESDPLQQTDVDAWMGQLSDPDLDLREQAFERAVRTARVQPALREALTRWAGSADDPELAWTSRLLLRELQGTQSLQAPDGWGVFGAPGWLPGRGGQSFDELMQQMEDLHGNLDQLFGELGADGLGVPVAPLAGSRSEGFQLRAGPDGVECEVTTEEDGQKVTRKYQAQSLEALLEQHPELRERVRIQEMGGNVPGLQGLGGLQMLSPRGSPGRWDSSALRSPLRTDILGVVIGPMAPERAQALGLEQGLGLSVERVEPGTIADVLGVRRGHVLLELNGQPLKSRDDISSALGARAADGEMRLELLDRWGQRRTRLWKPDPAQTDAGTGVPHEAGVPRRF